MKLIKLFLSDDPGGPGGDRPKDPPPIPKIEEGDTASTETEDDVVDTEESEAEVDPDKEQKD